MEKEALEGGAFKRDKEKGCIMKEWQSVGHFLFFMPKVMCLVHYSNALGVH